MNPLRLLVNLVLALVLVAVTCLSLASGLAVVWCRSWEAYDLTHESTQQNWAWIDGRPIHYYLDGPEGSPVVVLLHGRQVEGLQTWQEAARFLSRAGLRVLAIDLAGYGHSSRDPEADYSLSGQAQTAAKVLNNLHIMGATVVGHGWGSAVALQIAREQPQFVGGLVLVGPIVYDDDAPLWRPVADVPRLGRAMAWAFDAGGPLWERRLAGGFRHPSRLNSDYTLAAQEVSRIQGTLRAWTAMAASWEGSDLPAALGSIPQRALIIRGSHDARVSEKDMERLARDLPNAQSVAVDDAGHLVHLEQPARVHHLLLQFALGHTVE